MTTGIYFLSDPANGIVRYVGQSKDVKRRLYSHWAGKGKPHRLGQWIEELDLMGLRPKVRVIEVPQAALDKVESFYIDLHWATSFNEKDGCGRLRDDVFVRPQSAISVFYFFRNQWMRRFKEKLAARGVSKWKLNSSTRGGYAKEVLLRGCKHALRTLQHKHPRKNEFQGCWLQDGFQLKFPAQDERLVPK